MMFAGISKCENNINKHEEKGNTRNANSPMVAGVLRISRNRYMIEI